jgi:hypothetical protein
VTGDDGREDDPYNLFGDKWKYEGNDEFRELDDQDIIEQLKSGGFNGWVYNGDVSNEEDLSDEELVREYDDYGVYDDDNSNSGLEDKSNEGVPNFGGRLNTVLYSMTELGNAYLVEWPESLPMPVPGSTVLDLGKNNTIAYGGYSNKNGVEILLQSEFGTHSNWADQNENPYDKKLFPHLHVPGRSLEDLEGPTDQDLRGLEDGENMEGAA